MFSQNLYYAAVVVAHKHKHKVSWAAYKYIFRFPTASAIHKKNSHRVYNDEVSVCTGNKSFRSGTAEAAAQEEKRIFIASNWDVVALLSAEENTTKVNIAQGDHYLRDIFINYTLCSLCLSAKDTRCIIFSLLSTASTNKRRRSSGFSL